MKSILITILAIIHFSSISFAQTSDAGVRVISAITVTQLSDLHFGTFTIPTGNTKLQVNADNSRQATVPANVTLLSMAPTYHCAVFNVNGFPNATYVINMPLDQVVYLSNGTHTIEVAYFHAIPASTGVKGVFVANGQLDATGFDTFNLGAHLRLKTGDQAGDYIATFNITVSYD